MNPSLTLYDTTLRDGAQAEGINFSTGDKLRIIERLDQFGIHYIEGGFPGSNPKDMEFFEKARKLHLCHARLAAFGATRRASLAVDQDPQVRNLLAAETPVVTIVGKSWLLHVLEVLKTTPTENLAMIRETVAYLKAQGREVVYDAEHSFDGYKDNADYALACWQAAAEAGASHIVLCDTNGGTLPEEVTKVVSAARGVVGQAQLGIHTHDDSGLAVANALAALNHGATQVQGTINGYGERNGNCNLVTIIPNLQLKYQTTVVTPEKLRELRELSLFVDEVANQRPNPRAPYVGQTSFAHKGGQHVNAINKVIHSYEHINPELVGNTRRILVGEQSGRTNLMLKARELNIPLDEKAPETQAILARMKELENAGYEFEAADASFELLVRRMQEHLAPLFEFIEYHVSIRYLPEKDYDSCEATVKLAVNGERVYTVEEGDGPINALDAALRRALTKFYPQIAEVSLTDYKVRIVNSTLGTAARTRVLIESTDGHRTWTTVGVDTNIVEASWLALTESFEYYLRRRG